MLRTVVFGRVARAQIVGRSAIRRQFGVLSETETSALAGESSIDIIQSCYELRKSIQDLNDKYKGPLEEKNAKNTLFPFVFLLGNHSSGKSSFINYVLGKKVQVAGVAPTDDNFTIIAPGQDDQDRDGPALIGIYIEVLSIYPC